MPCDGIRAVPQWTWFRDSMPLGVCEHNPCLSEAKQATCLRISPLHFYHEAPALSTDKMSLLSQAGALGWQQPC